MKKLIRRLGVTRHQLTARESATSLSSVILDPSNYSSSRRPPSVVCSNVQTGSAVTPFGFCLCCSSTVLLSLGIGLTGISIWSMTFKLHYASLVDCSIELAYFSLPAALLCFPCFWIAFSVHNNKKSRRFLPLLLLMLSFALCLLAITIYLGMSHKFHNTQSTKLHVQELNHTMHSSMSLYSTDVQYRSSWDYVQTKLQCCGINNSNDWLQTLATIPKSCCENCSESGCLNKTIRELIWQIRVFTGLSCAVLFVMAWTLISIAIVYFIHKRNSTG